VCQETVAAGIVPSTEGLERAARVGRELHPQGRGPGEDSPIVARVGEQQDCPGRAEVPLLGAQRTDGSLDVVESGLGFDRRVERPRCRDTIGRSEIARDRHGDLGLPPDRRMKPRGKAGEKRQVGTIADRRSDRVQPEAEFVAKYGRKPRKQVEVDVGCEAGFDGADMGVGHADERADPPGAQAGSCAGHAQVLADAPE
jgi:hypothetical protein